VHALWQISRSVVDTTKKTSGYHAQLFFCSFATQPRLRHDQLVRHGGPQCGGTAGAKSLFVGKRSYSSALVIWTHDRIGADGSCNHAGRTARWLRSRFACAGVDVAVPRAPQRILRRRSMDRLSGFCYKIEICK
jgi:hypothetical protein